MSSRPTVAPTAALPALRQVTGSRGSREHPEEQQPVGKQAQEHAERDGEPADPPEAGQPEELQDLPGEDAGRGRDAEGHRQSQAQPEQREQVDPQAAQERWRLRGLPPLLGQRGPQVTHPTQARVARDEQADHPDGGGGRDGLVDDRVHRLLQPGRESFVDVGPQPREGLRISG
jgi:hypothetical protein